MPSLAELTDAYPQPDQSLPVERLYVTTGRMPEDGEGGRPLPIVNDIGATVDYPRPEPRPEPLGDSKLNLLAKGIENLLGGGTEERYKLWPEKLVRSGISAAHDVMSGETPQWAIDPASGDVHTSLQMTEKALDMSALAGTGGLMGTTDATLGATPFLRPALKYGDKIYKAPQGGQHLDALPAHLADEFNRLAMSGEDINHYKFGFMNENGQFLDREKALEHAINTGLVDPHTGQYGALTSTLLADSSKPGAAIESLAKSNPFFSAVEHQVNQIQQPKMTGEQWLGTLANKPGVKAEEMQWTGLKDFLEENKGKSLTKEQVQEHLQNNKVELKEINKSALNKPINEAKAEGFSGPTKYHSYQLPGGENYREMLLTLPKNKVPMEQHKVIRQDGHVDSTYNNAEGAANRAKEIGGTVKQAETLNVNGPDSYKSSHWDEPNILVHVRMNDRMIEGKKSLHLEEGQSDWHQKGSREGYKEKYKPEDLKMASTAEMTDPQRFWYVKAPDNVFQIPKVKAATFEDAKNYVVNEKFKGGGAVPDAPFKGMEKWSTLILKRMIREASEKGYDRLSWTPGEAQAARYDLSKQVDTLKYSKGDKDAPTGMLVAKDKNGGVVMSQAAKPDELANIVGKEVAKKLLDTKFEQVHASGTGYHELNNADLKIGGEFHKKLYDELWPKILEKISKEHGVKVKTDRINKPEFSVNPEKLPNGREVYDVKVDGKLYSSFHTLEEAKAVVAKAEKEKKGTPIHYIDLPQSLKDQALSKGFPLFSGGYQFIPVVGNPFEKKEK